MDRFFNCIRYYVQLLSVQGSTVTLDTPYPPLISPHVNILSDFSITILSSILILIIRFYLQRHFFPKHIISRYIPPSDKSTQKCSETLFYSFFYSTTWTLSMIVYSTESWRINFFSPNKMSELYQNYPPSTLSFGLKHFYLIETGFYIGSFIFLIIDTKRKDFLQYIIHHVATVLLLIGSYLIGYVRIGLIVVMLHDFGDISLYVAKSLHYLGFHPYDTVVFVSFVIGFYVSRLLLLPRLIYSIVIETFLIAAETPDFNKWTKFWPMYVSHWAVFLVLLNVLMLLHAFWYNLALRVAWREIKDPGATSREGDIRSDSEDE
uniref:TLC domain-containing protein n=1 Tax=Timspurckia oligopyrenoides TaxID=708627 RepID=A0A7S1EPI5_9RHOD|mmetsp:Transcript_10522/g.18989  ORF Transcript_10522/g.18989 Transcript_10522/m.18989 type:complete len:320 (+) Transcript_10522:178-1137(+)